MIINQALEGHVPLVEAVLEPVVFVPRVADVHHGLPVCGRVVGVPLQQQAVLARRLRRIDTVGPSTFYYLIEDSHIKFQLTFTGICYLRQGPGLICLAGHFQVFVKTPVTVLELLPGSGTLKAAGKHFLFLFFFK